MKKIILAVSIVFMSAVVFAQDFTVKGDFVSSYIWRGIYQTGVSIQPTLGVSYKGLSFTAWGSTDFDGTSSSSNKAAKEIDFTVAYAIGNSGLTISVADMWWAGQGAQNYFHYRNKNTGHHFEGGLTYTIPSKKVPVSLTWYTMFAGDDQNMNGKQNYSSYLELNCPFTIKKIIDMTLTCGAVPYAAVNQYGNSRFAITNVAVKGAYAIKITDSFSLPIFVQAICNPMKEDIHLVCGISLGIL